MAISHRITVKQRNQVCVIDIHQKHLFLHLLKIIFRNVVICIMALCVNTGSLEFQNRPMTIRPLHHCIKITRQKLIFFITENHRFDMNFATFKFRNCLNVLSQIALTNMSPQKNQFLFQFFFWCASYKLCMTKFLVPEVHIISKWIRTHYCRYFRCTDTDAAAIMPFVFS